MWELACVGAGLARAAGTSLFQMFRGDAIAGKPAPTEKRSATAWQINSVKLWEPGLPAMASTAYT